MKEALILVWKSNTTDIMEILSLNEFLTNDVWFYDRLFNSVSVTKNYEKYEKFLRGRLAQDEDRWRCKNHNLELDYCNRR